MTKSKKQKNITKTAVKKFNWEKLKDIMMKLDQEKTDGYVYEIVKDIIEKEKFELDSLPSKEIKKIINAGLWRFYDFCDSEFDYEIDKNLNFDYLMMIGITEILYRKYPEVRRKWLNGVWAYEW